MPLGLWHNCENPDKGYAILLGVRMWIHTPARNLDSISTHCFDNRDDRWREALIVTSGVRSFGRQTLQTQKQIELYQAWIFKAFNQKFRVRIFKKGDLVLAVRRPMVMTHKTKEKFQTKWEGSFVVESVYSNEALLLITPDGDTLIMPISGRFLKKCYP